MGKRKFNHQWRRVMRTPMPAEQKRRQDRNKSTMKDHAFKKACKKAGVQPTKRQASKWNNGKGIARENR